jgi:hypothetical protein
MEVIYFILFVILFFTIVNLAIEYMSVGEVYGRHLKLDRIQKLTEDREFELIKSKKDIIHSGDFYIVKLNKPLQKYGICSLNRRYGTANRFTKSCKYVDELFNQFDETKTNKVSNNKKTEGYLK